jgi:hypothetical protein
MTFELHARASSALSLRRTLLCLTALPFLAACSSVERLTGTGDAKCIGPLALTVGTPVSGNSATTNRCNTPNGDTGNLFSLTVTEQTNIEFSVSSGWNAAIGVWTSAKEQVTVRDGVSVSARAFLPPGEYIVSVWGGGNEGGPYTLTTRPTTASGCARFVSASAIGAVISGTIDATDCLTTVGTREENYSFWAAAGRTVTVTVSADQAAFAALLKESASGFIAVVNPRALTSTGAGSTTTFAYTTPTAGFYGVGLVGGGSAGPLPVNYTIRIN